MLLDIIRSPTKAIAAAKKKGEKHALELLLVNSLLLALATALLLARFSLVSQAFLGASIVVASTVFLITFAGSLFFAYVLEVIVNTLGGKGRYSDGLAAMACSLTAITVGLFASSLLLFIPLFGAVLSMLIVALTSALSFATLYRAIKELFRVDMLVSFISVSILLISVVAAVYSISILTIANKLVVGA